MNSSYKCDRCQKRFYKYKTYKNHINIINCERLLPNIENVRKDILEIKTDIQFIIREIENLKRKLN